MHTIHKFPLQLTDRQDLELPAGALFLSIQFQRGQLVLWALVPVDPKPPGALWASFAIQGTGNPFPDYLNPETGRPWWFYHSTLQDPGTGLVWHIFTRGVLVEHGRITILRA